MESVSRAKTVGFFVLIMIAMLVVTVLWFSQDRTEKATYDIVTNRSANGIVPQAAVELYGLSVGRVESISFMADKPGYVQIRLAVDKKAPINQSTYATITSRGVTGASFIALADDDKLSDELRSSSLLAATPPGVTPTISLRPGTLDTFTDGIASFAERADEVLENVNRLISSENEEVILTTIENIGVAADQIAKLSESFNNNLVGEVKGVTQQLDATLKSLESLIANTNTLVANAGKPGGVMHSVNEGAQALSEATNHLRYVTLPQLEAAAGSASNTMRAAKRLIEKLEDQPDMLVLGEGRTIAAPGESGYRSPYAAQ